MRSRTRSTLSGHARPFLPTRRSSSAGSHPAIGRRSSGPIRTVRQHGDPTTPVLGQDPTRRRRALGEREWHATQDVESHRLGEDLVGPSGEPLHLDALQTEAACGHDAVGTVDDKVVRSPDNDWRPCSLQAYQLADVGLTDASLTEAWSDRDSLQGDRDDDFVSVSGLAP